ncbi:FAD binding domain-containing protein [Bordetella avium]|uniref:Carbon monoxide dehydrogenase medium chain n=1 Tax=Bordetella avium (strain 197N) TaxID=360910 RepID=Q2KW66_BORA1|nr:xanthine dehydrogenase family protein subunit M [Bordetella avium]RIQ52101.1 xanthine dehydrogenase family protein subunit M [Bordetella avium]RIQ68289.1 xanthine dehydrogenase family protein subunit M [Bordetella avium]CAJ50349.1 carbon monoxide dehydrogenase medium chain [Bordetella avium 197N]
MKAPVFDYYAPDTLAAALDLLSSQENARVLAGGQSLMAMLNMRFAFPDCLVDINALSELAYIREEEGQVRVGAMTRQRDVEFSELIAMRLPLWKEAILNVGHRQTRNRGTVGGSLCQLDPSAEIPTVCMAMDAVLTVSSVRGERAIPMAEFPAAYMTPSMQPDELLTGLRVQPWPAGHGWAFLEFSRRHGDFAIVSTAVLLLRDEDGRVSRASITLGGVGPFPLRMSDAENSLLGTQATSDDIARAAELCGQVEASSDSYVQGWYRQRLAKEYTARALRLALSRTGARHGS